MLTTVTAGVLINLLNEGALGEEGGVNYGVYTLLSAHNIKINCYSDKAVSLDYRYMELVIIPFVFPKTNITLVHRLKIVLSFLKIDRTNFNQVSYFILKNGLRLLYILYTITCVASTRSEST